MKKNSILIIVTIILLLIISLLIISLKKEKKEVDIPNKVTTTSTTKLVKKENIITKKEQENIININIENNTDYIELQETIINFLNNNENINKTLNFEITNIKLNKEDFVLKYSNIPFDYLKCMETADKYNTFYLNDSKLYSQNYEGCYLLQNKFIKIIDNKYVALVFSGESNNVMFVYDSHLKLIDTLEAVNIEYNNPDIEFINYEENDPKYLLNTYKYEIESEKPVKTKIEEGTESYCNIESGEGICSED